jgi:hypothetical protein
VQGQCAVDAHGTCTDAFVATLHADGRALRYSTYLGGSDINVTHGLAVDSAGQVVVTGATASPNFPLRAAVQKHKRGEVDAFVTKLTPNGSTLAYSTYLGGSAFEEAWAVAVDAAGQTSSADFPIIDALQATPGGPCSTDGASVSCSPDAFVTTLTADGTALGYSTYLGGTARPELGELGFEEAAHDIAVDHQGNAYVVGATTALDFPARRALQGQCAIATDATCQDGFVTKIGSRARPPRAYLPLITR